MNTENAYDSLHMCMAAAQSQMTNYVVLSDGKKYLWTYEYLSDQRPDGWKLVIKSEMAPRITMYPHFYMFAK